MKKRLWALCLVFVLCLTFCACSGNPDTTPGTGTGDAGKATQSADQGKGTAAPTQAPTQAPTAAPTAAPETYAVSITVDDMAYTYVVTAQYGDKQLTWDRIVENTSIQYQLDEMALSTRVPADGSEVEIKAVLAENAPYKITGWAGDFTSDSDVIKFKPTGNTKLQILVEPLYGESLALGSENDCSVTYESASGAWGLEGLTDGDYLCKFSTSGLDIVDPDTYEPSEPVTIDINLGSAKDFSLISLVPRCDTLSIEDGVPNYPLSFDIQVSNDGENFTTVKSVDLETSPGEMMQTYDLGAQNAQYIRLNVRKFGPEAGDEGVSYPYRVQLAEVLVFNAA